MVPQAVRVLPAFPLTPNGKVDRRALADAPAPAAAGDGTAAAPPSAAGLTEMEQTLCRIWQDVLGVPRVGMTDNFFDLGGHSLLVVQVQRRLRDACGQEVPITDMFRLPTIKALAAHLGGAEPQANAVDEGLARAQRRIQRARRAWTA
jgi:acyl carrier protein